LLGHREQEPSAEAIRLLRQELYANARNVPTSTLGGGSHGHLGLLMMPAADYLLLAGHPYNLTAALPDIPDYTTAADDDEQKEWNKLYDVDCKDYYESQGMNMQLSSANCSLPRFYGRVTFGYVWNFLRARSTARYTPPILNKSGICATCSGRTNHVLHIGLLPINSPK
jgi:hypothetical protein